MYLFCNLQVCIVTAYVEYQTMCPYAAEIYSCELHSVHRVVSCPQVRSLCLVAQRAVKLC